MTDQQKHQQKPVQDQQRKRMEFSKLLIALVMLTYFIGVGIGAYVVLQVMPSLLGTLLTYIGAPTGVAIAFYSWKARAENLVKLGCSPALANENQGYGGVQGFLGHPISPFAGTGNIDFGWEQQAASTEWGQRPPPNTQGEYPGEEP